MQFIEGGVTAAKGFLAGGIHCGIRKNKSKADLAMIFSKTPCAAAGVYTQNLVKGAPILVTRKNIADGRAQAVICNSGNANTCNADGEKKAWRMCEIAGEALGIDPHDVIVASTGVIGQILPIAPIENAAPALAALLNENGSNMAAKAIMTTDTIEKECAVKITLGDKEVRIGGISKGSGMIHPNMATMLCFVTTDCAISVPMLQKAIKAAADTTFNMISVDGDTSTNDTILGLANGASGIRAEGEDAALLEKGLTDILGQISYMLVKDGEGASKVMHITVSGAASDEDACRIARTVGHSQLVKTAIYGQDANWGRIVAAVGRSGAQVDPSRVRLVLCGIERFRDGQPVNGDKEAELSELLKATDIPVEIHMGLGDGCYDLRASDLGHEYVSLNADYRS